MTATDFITKMDTIENGIKELSTKVNKNATSSNNEKSILSNIYHSGIEAKAISELICFGFGTATIPEFIYPLMQIYSYQYPYIKQYLDLHFSKPYQD